MADTITQYVDPGVYSSEVIVPASSSVTPQRTLALVGVAPRTRRASNEPVVRGRVTGEELTVAQSSPHTASLVSLSNRDRNASALYLNGNALGLGDWSWAAAELVGAAWSVDTINVSDGVGGTQYLTISLDHKVPVTIDLNASSLIVLKTAATPLEIAAAVNAVLVSSYGTEYASAVSAAIVSPATKYRMKIASPLTSTASAVKIMLSPSALRDVASKLSAAWTPSATSSVDAGTSVIISDDLYVSTATYTISYVAVNTTADPLALAVAANPLVDIVSVGTAPGESNYKKGVDYSAGSNVVNWASPGPLPAQVRSLDTSTPITIVAGDNDKLYFKVNGRAQITVTLAAGALDPAVAVTNINAQLVTAYGAEFAHVASVVDTTYLQLKAPVVYVGTRPEQGSATSIEFLTGINNAFADVFGTYTLPYLVKGTGRVPSVGVTYYASYDYQRPAADYTKATRVYNPDQLLGYTSPLTISNYLQNALAVAGNICFENQASSIFLIQIDNAQYPLPPTQTQIDAAIAVAKNYVSITEIVPLNTSLDTHVECMNHVSQQTSSLVKHPRRGWYGMARGTSPGDPDTEGTLIHRSTQTLQPGNQSAGRGRQFLLAPTDISRTFALDTGTEVTVDLDGSYMAAAVAAAYTALPNPSSTLMGIAIAGFDSEGFGTYLDGERHAMASKGVMVVTYKDGKVRIYDPVSTEAGGGGKISFVEPAASAQKDAVSFRVDNLIDSNLTGVVPDDLSDFISDIKTYISIGVESAITDKIIAPYRDSTGFPRQMELSSDVMVGQHPSDPRKFTFKYWYNLKYPAKWFFGEYSVDNPFFAPQ
jgi:hypothetical protein